jgi:glycyl-tRNA synthetase beta chain
MMTHTFLIELTTEELPPHALRTVANNFAQELALALQHAELTYGSLQWFATPRRLALKVQQLARRQPDKIVEKRGPAITQAFDLQGEPTQAAQKWAQSCHISLEQADHWHSPKGSWLRYQAQVTGASATSLLLDRVNQALKNLKSVQFMHWGNHPIPFIRPVHSVVALLDEQLIEGAVLGVSTSRTLSGHRFMGEASFTIRHAEEYPQILLERGRVIADYAERQAVIRREINKTATRLGSQVDLDESLLEEVTALVEWPVVLSASFDPQFLSLPAEALVYTMKKDQRYFPLYDQQGQLLSQFIFVANIDPADPSAIIHGNEQVIRPRLADAQFFFNADRRQPLADLLPRLQTMLFQQQLGTLYDKAQRLQKLAGLIATRIQADPVQASRAALLSKCDLASQMVFECPTLQGTMGMHYARADGEGETIAQAIQAQYQPRFAGDAVPSDLIACSVAIADKLDTLVGIIGIGAQPSGDKDPFALRRAALGFLRILIENRLPLALPPIIDAAIMNYADQLTQPQLATTVLDFILNRLLYWYQEQGFSVALVQAVLARQRTLPSDIDTRIKALAAFYTIPAAQALAAAHKRVSHLLAKVDLALLPDSINVNLLQAPAEQLLSQQIKQLQQTLPPLLNRQEYSRILDQLAGLQRPLELFFSEVMVLVEDLPLRLNRLRLLYEIQELFLQIADISLLSASH